MLCLPNFTCIFSLSLSIFKHNIYLGKKKIDGGEGEKLEVITLDYIYPLKKNTSKICSTKYGFNISDLLCPKPLIITGVT